MLFQTLLMALVVSVSVAEGDKSHTARLATGHRPEELKLSQPAAGHRGKAFRETALAAQPVDPAGGNQSFPGKGAPRDQAATASTTRANLYWEQVFWKVFFELAWYPLALCILYPLVLCVRHTQS
mmetsp:Transcript_112356/g.217665  ORF Transcript_112356/g.217665 Transcript_112356/m.217665 type:complete len:125 (-) Transcript_112356:47-421(-)